MAQLFGKGTIKSHVEVLGGFDMSKVDIIRRLHQDWTNGLLADEVKYKETFNQLFFGELLGYENRVNRIPEGTILGVGSADITLGYFDEGKYTQDDIQVVCELKGSKTNLVKKQFGHGGLSPVGQGFSYKTGLKNCKWLLVSNFYEIRLYRDNQTDVEVWNLDELMDPEDNYFNLRKIYLLLHKDNLLAHTGKSKTEALLSHFREEQKEITIKFYKEYKELRIALINDIKTKNPGISIETIIEKAQKIIDRLIFIFFCEDKGLLPDKKIKEYINKGSEMDMTPWESLKKFFQGIDQGSPNLGIPDGFNGGLFRQDDVLDTLSLGDHICKKLVDLTNFDFDDKLSVNVLGHIFEQSISDLENLKIDLLGHEIKTEQLTDTGKGRRKKDGIFYTPEYIVDYIVQNSVMKYLNEKEDELIRKYRGEKTDPKLIAKAEIQTYQEYQQVLQNIKVLDPACGSGAFLVRVFDVLFEENKRVGSILNSLFDEAETYKNILTNNIYGVDLNEESVEITKLSLRLKSAQKGKKLNNLDANIKCGNSLIDDPTVAGDKAFDWKKEFPSIFHKEEIKTWMITRATHNTRISERMVKFGVQVGAPVLLDEQDEIEITQTINEIVAEDKLKILAYNICRDHVHMILQCTENQRDAIVQKMKSISARKYNINHGLTIPSPKDHTDPMMSKSKGSGPLVHDNGKIKGNVQNHLRGQKYNWNEIQDENYLTNALEYVQNNREHHGLSPLSTNTILQVLIQRIISDKYVFDKIQYEYFGGFDVVVGNPPYVQLSKLPNISEIEKKYYLEKYKTSGGRLNTFIFFIHLGNFILKKDGYLSYIIPNTLLTQEYYSDTRKLLLDKMNLTTIINYPFLPFKQAVVENITFIANKKDKQDLNISVLEQSPEIIKEKGIIKKENVRKDENYILSMNDNITINHIDNRKFNLLNDFVEINQGIALKGDKSKSVKTEKQEGYYRLIDGKHINKYQINRGGDYLEYNIERIHSCKRKDIFETSEKLLFRRVSSNLIFTYDKEQYFALNTLVVINKKEKSELELKYLLSLLNSKLMNYYYVNKYKSTKTVFSEIQARTIGQLPIPNISLFDQQYFIEEADEMLVINKNLHELIDKFLHRIQDNLRIKKLTRKLESFYEGDFKDFIAELKKQKVSLSLVQQDEWEPYFKEYQEKILTLKGEIESTDKEIDEMVFELYGLSEEERRVVEGR